MTTDGSNGSNGNILTAEFPRAVRGYSPVAVDDFVRQLGERLETMQGKLNEQAARASGLQAMLTKANQDIASYLEKESAISHGVIAIEQRRVSVDQEIEQARRTAHEEVTSLKAGAETETQELLTRAQAQVHDLLTNVQSEAQELRSRAQIDAHDLVRSANETADEVMSNAQTLADETISNAQSEADEILMLARAAADQQAERLRSLCTEYEDTSARVRRALEAQLALLPTPGSFLETLSNQGIAVTTAGESNSRLHVRAA